MSAIVTKPIYGSEPDSGRGHAVTGRGLYKRYGQVNALDGVDLDIDRGKFMVLLGPSGSGKSTLLRGIAGIERFDAGSVHFDGALISNDRKHSPAETRNLSMVFQDYALWPHMTVMQNVAYALRRRHLENRESHKRAHEILERVGLGAKAGNYPGELSGGQQQRVALARALVGRPALLLFDEPLSNLDADLRERLRVEISTLTREAGATALYITHDQGEAFALADEVGVLSGGRLEQRGTPEEIYQRPATAFVARFTGVSGSFLGLAVGERHGYTRVRVGDHELSCMSTTDIAPGTRIELFFRPTASRLRPRSSPTANAIDGTIIDIAFRGRGYEHVVDSAYGQLTSVFDVHPWTRGTACSVELDPDGSIAFPSM